jgi:hypothetical protein
VKAPSRKPWDWEKTLAIGLLTLGTIVVVMIGVWLFGANQGAIPGAPGEPIIPSTANSLRVPDENPQNQ